MLDDLTETPAIRETTHRGDDDLLSAGLGAHGLLRAEPPCADADQPTAAEQRRRAIWSNWRGIADLPTALANGLPAVPGREFHALARLPGARHPHRVMLQLPDSIDNDARCLIVTAASGSRGIYGAQAVAAHWALPRGLPVVSTDKGGGCDWFDAGAGVGFDLSGCPTDDPSAMTFRPEVAAAGTPRIATCHAQSGDNPEADWGRHLKQAAAVGLRMLDRALPAQAPFRFDNTRIIAVGLSNAGAAVLRAAEDPQPWLAAAVSAAPNVFPPDGGRALFDHATEAALWMPAALSSAALGDVPSVAPLLTDAQVERRRALHVEQLQRHGLLPRGSLQAAASLALQRLRAVGWSDESLRAANLSTMLDMWRAVGVTYSFAYGRFGVDAHPLGHRFAMLDEAGRPRAAAPGERARWWSLGAGIVPGEGVEIVDPDPLERLETLRALRNLAHDDNDDARRVRAGLAATRAALPRADLPLWLLHGVDDGLIPERFSSAAYLRACRGAGCTIGYWRLHHVQHFDALLGLPAFGARYRPLLPLLHEALAEAVAHVLRGAPGPSDRQWRADAAECG